MYALIPSYGTRRKIKIESVSMLILLYFYFVQILHYLFVSVHLDYYVNRTNYHDVVISLAINYDDGYMPNTLYARRGYGIILNNTILLYYY